MTRQASSAMVTLLNTQRQLLAANVVTIIAAGGGITRLTDADHDVTVVSWYDSASHTFSSAGPALTCGQSKLAVGLQTDKKVLTLNCRLTDLFDGVPWAAAVQRGYLDNAAVMVEKVITADWSNPLQGTLIDCWGQVSQPTVSRYVVQLEIASWLEVVLAQNLPRNVYQTQCLHTLFDSGCALTKSSFAVTGTAGAGSTAASIVTGLANPDDYFALGTITFTSGANSGITRTVGTYLSGTAVTIGPFPVAPATGDAFTIYPGCNKLLSVCINTFHNEAHFRGYPFLPSPENAL